MITLKEIEEAILELEDAPKSYETCRKLATFYTLRELMFGGGKYSRSAENRTRDVIGDYGDSVFLQTIAGRDAAAVWMVMDELMEVLETVNPRLYDGVMDRVLG
jgi:hypothetical protein